MTRSAAPRELIRAGELVAFPTETVYGLGANALDPDAIDKIYAAKGRPADESADRSREFDRNGARPGARMAGARRKTGAHVLARAADAGVAETAACAGSVDGRASTRWAIRMPANPIAQALIREAGVPIAAPSANRFTELSPTTAQHVRDGLGDRVAMVLDGGRTTGGDRIHCSFAGGAGGGIVATGHGNASRRSKQ